MTFAHLFRPDLADAKAYVPPDHAGITVKLDANEAPPNPSPRVRDAVLAAIGRTPLERYPDAQARELKRAIAARTGARAEEIVVGTGSDEVIAIVLTALSRPREKVPQPVMLTVTPSFVMYKITARSLGHKPVEVPLDASWDLDVAQMKRAIELLPPNVVFIATPNNPTGNRMSEGRLREVIVAARDALVVVDEAYVDFASGSARALRAEYPNVAIMGTLSKLGLAALRVGWIEAPAEVARELEKVRLPFNVSATSQAGAIAALGDAWQDVQAHVAAIRRERERVVDGLSAAGAVVTPSEANFVWVKTARPAADVLLGLASGGVLVRSFHAAGGRLAHQLRISIGSPGDNDLMLEAFRACASS